MRRNQGFALCLPSTGIRQYLPLARYADDAGVDGIFTIESRLTGDAITPLAAYAAATARIRIGGGRTPGVDPQPRPAGGDVRNP